MVPIIFDAVNGYHFILSFGWVMQNDFESKFFSLIKL